MFANACKAARNFTYPVIISQRCFKGECTSGIGTFVVINEDGWFVTAFHIIKQFQDLLSANKAFKELEVKRKEIESNVSLKPGQKQQQLNGPLKIQPSAITNVSIWMGWDGVKLDNTLHVLPEVDLAVGKLTGFDKSKVKTYPTFKDPSKEMEQGTSLCKFGFPFHSISPTFEDGGFKLPPGSIPIPIFPIEGIFTRYVEVEVDPPGTHKYPLKFIETSSPGLRGQSGGPTFDQKGTIWAIQCRTMHFPLGFGADQTGKNAEYIKNQYLNVGWGAHAESIVSLFREKGISFQIADY